MKFSFAAGVPEKSAVPLLLFLSGLFGFLLGATAYACWQNAVESAQAVAGIIQYPPDNPFYIYHIKAWTILHQIPALLLLMGISEIHLSIFLSAIAGMVSLQALALLTYAFSRDLIMSFLFPFFILHTHAFAIHSNYPVMLMGTQHTYGMLGLSFVMLSLALLGLGRYRAGGFLAGFSPAVHATLGIFGIIIVLTASLFHPLTKQERLKIVGAGAAGFALSLLSYLLHRLLVDHGTSLPAAEIAPYINTLVHYWDMHRMRVSLLSPGVLGSTAVLSVSLLCLFFSKSLPQSSRFLLKCFIVISAVGGAGIQISWMQPENFPPWLLTTMPSRVLNLNGMALAAFFTGLAWHYRERKMGLLAAALLTALFLSVDCEDNARLILFFTLIGAASLWLLKLVRPQAALNGKKLASLFSIFFYAAWSVSFFGETGKIITGTKSNYTQFYNYENDPFLKQISERKGLLLSAPEIEFVQLLTRRPILLAPYCLDIIPYAPGAAPRIAAILKEVYEIDFFNPPGEVFGTSSLNGSASITVWQQRSLEEWKEIAKKYAFSQVLTSRDTALQLPLAGQNEAYDLYEIPS